MISIILVTPVSVSFHPVKGVFEGLPRLVNVPERALLQPTMPSLIGSAGDILVSFIQKSQSRAQGAIGVTPALRRRSVVRVSSFIANRLSYFMDSAVNFLDGVVARANESRTIIRLQQIARFAKVGKGMKIVGTLGLSRRSQSKKQESR